MIDLSYLLFFKLCDVPGLLCLHVSFQSGRIWAGIRSTRVNGRCFSRQSLFIPLIPWEADEPYSPAT